MPFCLLSNLDSEVIFNGILFQFKRLLNRELSQFAERSKSGNQICEYISTTFLGKTIRVVRRDEFWRLSRNSASIDCIAKTTSMGSSVNSLNCLENRRFLCCERGGPQCPGKCRSILHNRFLFPVAQRSLIIETVEFQRQIVSLRVYDRFILHRPIGPSPHWPTGALLKELLSSEGEGKVTNILKSYSIYMILL